MTPKQKNILRKIAERTQGPEDWCAVEDPCPIKTKTQMTNNIN
jgi:hypothetical protein